MDGYVIAQFAYLVLAESFIWIAAAITGFCVVVALITALLEVIPQERG